jgi:exonuclease III
MKLVSWNCKCGFTAPKAEFIRKYDADLYIIQECTEENFENIKNEFCKVSFFCDDVENKYGVGMFSNKFEFKILPEHNKKFRYIVPYKIYSNSCEFILFSIWTKDKDENKDKIKYTEHIWKAINFDGYKNYLHDSVILVGDFNSDNNLDKTYISNRVHSHNDIVGKLREYNIESVYHKYYNCINGNEKDPTLLWKMDMNNKFPIDYFFVSDDFKIRDVNVGSLKEWEENKLSDHCPLIVELDKKHINSDK